MDNRKDSVSGAHSTNSLQPLIPHMPVSPKEVCPFSSQQSLNDPTSLPGLQQQARLEVSEYCSCSLAPTEINPQQFSHLENCSWVWKPASSIPLQDKQVHQPKGTGNRFRKGGMVVSRITECMSEMVMESLTT
jgi:hypothetical protein